MRFRTYIIVPTVTYGFWKLSEFALINQEAKMSFEQRCRKYGYDTERHFVTTDDGYILQIFRLVGKNKDLNHHPSPPVLLQHGYMDSWYSMISNCEKSPAIYLANNGIDVWVGNNRGGSYSKFHRTLVLDVDSKYSDYSFEDMGLYDTKAMIEHISKETKTPKVSYVGFSQGGTQMFYGLALNNEWFKNHLSLFVALASPVNWVSEYPKPSDEITARSTINRVCKYLRNSQYASKFGKKLIWFMMKLYPDYGRNYSSDISEGKPELNDVESLQRAKFIFLLDPLFIMLILYLKLLKIYELLYSKMLKHVFLSLQQVEDQEGYDVLR